MRIGYRADESHRVNSFRDTYKFAYQTEFAYEWEDHAKNLKQKEMNSLLGSVWFEKYSLPHRNRWMEIPFRVGEFPLIEDGIVQYDVQKYWSDKSLVFPEDSNCQFCFWKKPQQLRKNWDNQPGIMGAAAVVESMTKSNLLAHMSLLQLKNIAPQLELFQMKGGSCQGGYCTD